MLAESASHYIARLTFFTTIQSWPCKKMILILDLLLIFSVISTGSARSQHDLRLVEGATNMEGRLEIYYDGSWGTICHYGFSLPEATVACRQLGFVRAVSVFELGFRRKLMHIAYTNCNGNEESFSECYRVFGSFSFIRCPNNDVSAGVVCSDVQTNSTDPATGNGMLRLAGGPDPYEGRIEVYIEDMQVWGRLCIEYWTWQTAELVCQRLEYRALIKEGLAASRYGNGTGPIAKCNLLILYASNGELPWPCDIVDPSLPNTTSTCANKLDRYVVCKGHDAASPGSLRLLNGSLPTEGRLEYFSLNAWKRVCNQNWTLENSLVLCRQLGMPTPTALLPGGTFGVGGAAVGMFEDVIDCLSTEHSPTYCEQNRRLEPCVAPDVAIQCGNWTNAVEGDIRLSGGPSPNVGRVEYYHGGEWGRVCKKDWSYKDAKVACRQLGFYSVISRDLTVFLGQRQGSIVVIGFDCTGKEDSLAECELHGGVESCAELSAALHCDSEPTINAQDYDIDLVNGANDMEGRIRMFYQGQWGTVCDDYFNLPEAIVACRQLGFSTASRVKSFGSGAGEIIMDDVNCNGNEDKLADCYYLGGNVFCSHYEDVGVVCLNSTEPTPTPPTPTLFPSTQAKIRLVGGPNPYEGRVEFYIINANSWATICGTGWEFSDAERVCQTLQYRPAIDAGLSSPYGVAAGELAQCPEDFWSAYQILCYVVSSSADCSHSNPAFAVCAGTEKGSQGSVRLVNGSERTEGRVEIYDKNQWKTVCADDWTFNHARVICRQLGMPPPTSAVPGGLFGGRETPVTLPYEIQCQGDETYFWICPRNPRDTHCEYLNAAIQCGVWINATNGDIRLSGGPGPNEGRVEFYYDNEWGTVCSTYWDDNDAQVVCRQLGFYDGITRYPNNVRGSQPGPVLLSDVQCTGDEFHITECPAVLGPVQDCQNYFDAQLHCNTKPTVTAYVRLINGPYPNQGLIQVEVDGTWGTICDNGWDYEDAQVICRQLGYYSVVASLEGYEAEQYFGTTVGEILLYYIGCYGHENNIFDCTVRETPYDICNHEEDVGVICRSDIYPSDYPREDLISDPPGGGGGLSGTQIRNIILITLVCCKALLFLCWVSRKYCIRSGAAVVEVHADATGITSTDPSTTLPNQYEPVIQAEDVPPSYNEVASEPEKFVVVNDTASPPPVYTETLSSPLGQERAQTAV